MLSLRKLTWKHFLPNDYTVWEYLNGVNGSVLQKIRNLTFFVYVWFIVMYTYYLGNKLISIL